MPGKLIQRKNGASEKTGSSGFVVGSSQNTVRFRPQGRSSTSFATTMKSCRLTPRYIISEAATNTEE